MVAAPTEGTNGSVLTEAEKQPRAGQITKRRKGMSASCVRTLVCVLVGLTAGTASAVYIETGASTSSKYEGHARDMAREYGWAFEKLKGEQYLLKKLVMVTETTDEILVVPPEHVIDFNAVEVKSLKNKLSSTSGFHIGFGNVSNAMGNKHCMNTWQS